MSEKETNISGISDNLSEAISQEIERKEEVRHLGFLQGKHIAISVSESEEIDALGLSKHHIDDISIELARYLLVNGATMLYGGDLRVGGFTEKFAELSYLYKHLSDKQFRFINYFPFPTSKQITTPVLADFIKKQVSVKKMTIPAILGKIDEDKDYKPFNNIEDRYVYAECLTDMRITMGKECDARIVLGGRQTNFAGFYPGVIEEAYYTLKAGKPLFILGGYGGAGKSIAELIKGGNPEVLTNEFQFKDGPTIQFKEYVNQKGHNDYDYSILTKFLNQYNVESLSKLNGLTIEENEILFESTNIHEIIFILFKGLKKTFTH